MSKFVRESNLHFNIRPLVTIAKDHSYEFVLEELYEYMRLLSQLTSVTTVDEVMQFHMLETYSHSPGIILVAELGDKSSLDGKHLLIGTAKIAIEHKFTHGGKPAARLEDVVVDKEYRGRGVAGVLIDSAINIAKLSFRPYKISLACKPHLEDFYGKFGFCKSDNEMRMNLD